MIRPFYSVLSKVDEVSSASPLGTISAWVPHPEASQTTETLPDGWLPCDGSTITKGPWTGAKTPDLNSIGAFLRGGTNDKVLQMEDDQVQDHEHDDPGHQHSCSATSEAGSHHHSFDRYDLEFFTDHMDVSSVKNWAGDMKRTTKGATTGSASVSVSTSCSTSSHSSGIGGVNKSARSGSETRPINMKVSYVMRCW